MCGISGFVNFKMDFLKRYRQYDEILKQMCKVLYHRGPDENGRVLCKNYGLAHTRLSIIDLKNGKQPMTLRTNDNIYRIVYNCEIYNTKELRVELKNKGWQFKTTSDTEVILVGFAEYGIEIAKRLNGIFAFFVVDEKKKEGFLVRDQVGVKPLYYSIYENTLLFASEIKGIFAFNGIKAEVDKDGWNEILSIGPAKTYGKGVFKNINEVNPGYFIRISYNDISSHKYWELEACEHTLNYSHTIDKTRFLVTDAIKRQMISDVPIATFLSGGVDGSIVSDVCASELEKSEKKLGTFSFDFVDIRDLPTMADVDSSMLYFCKCVKPFYKVVLTGECADEIFGGYPWFHKKECFETNTFLWSMDISARKAVLKDEVIKELRMYDYISEAYENTINETPRLIREDKILARRREISYLNIKWFMQTLLDRMDRTSMYSGLEARVPFADIRIMEFVYNVPWNMKCEGGVEKSLLRNAAKGLLLDEVLYRKKSPYPKTYDPAYENLLAKALIEVIEDVTSPINKLVDKKKVYSFIKEKKDYGKPWYGQLMAGPQMIAYLLQINYWMEKYRI